MRESLRELAAIVTSWLRGEAPLPDLFAAWWRVCIARTVDTDAPIPYTVKRA